MEGDPVPVSAGGRIAMLAGFAMGLVLVASVACAVGPYLVEDRRERVTTERGDSEP